MPILAISMSQVILPRTGILAFMDDESRGQFASYGSLVSTAPGRGPHPGRGGEHASLYRAERDFQHHDPGAGKRGSSRHRWAWAIAWARSRSFNPDSASATVTSLQAGQLWTIDVEPLQEFLLDWPELRLRGDPGHQHHPEPAAETGQRGDPVQRDRAGLSQRAVPEARRRREVRLN